MNSMLKAVTFGTVKENDTRYIFWDPKFVTLVL